MNWVVLILLVPLFTGAFGVLSPRPSRARRGVFLGSAVVQLLLAIVVAALVSGGDRIVLAPGGWGASVGIVLVVDLLTGIMLVLAAGTAVACIVFAYASREAAVEHPLQLPLMQFLITGINLSFVTGDLFNLFVAFEVMLIASYALLSLESDNRNVRHAWSYLSINLVGSAIFLLGCGLTYGMFGSLNFAVIAERSNELAGDPLLVLLGLVFLVVFATKAGMFPLYYWLPNSYPILPGAMAAFYAGMLTKVGVYVLLRIFGTMFPADLPVVSELLAWGAGATMVFGVLGAVARDRVQHILSYHIISQIGFMVLAIGFATPLAITAAILYITHHIVVKATLFLVGGAVIHVHGTDRLECCGGLARLAPWLAAGFFLQAMSLAGIPPLSGFWGKYLIIVEGVALGQYVLVGASIVASILTLVSMMKVWLGCFWKAAPENGSAPVVRPGLATMSVVVTVMTAISLVIGLGVERFYGVAAEASRQVLDREGYIEAVLAVGVVPSGEATAVSAEDAGGVAK
ncbi:proton-conducting transporter membrane subunit [Opitutales bacterium ASA1]|uniref:proton-conducting transporter transmembrane domain-containing protein n=1 Tax=Congregicoccus parvus TaxID=3081749 RepID=UPI002B2DEA27|nr:proton-conducting transporter membrane subunit [Opitutales bacterium ASA1]